ncbi:hypothetical protein FOL47_007721 [Perkinsus chesapeaki]|uniref:Mediator of RNA polymerase II transcription subunit 6 n=1 Tax=Perkinsus chesapeaki TaxID=330153 RepID=A0A7J6LJN8_PERCH|nr:hypothetical protein FOL47_007721 [Perkinsus chesapeaki]
MATPLLSPSGPSNQYVADKLGEMSFRFPQFLMAEGLHPGNVMEYFYQSPFYLQLDGPTSLNDKVRKNELRPEEVPFTEGTVYELVGMNKEAEAGKYKAPCLGRLLERQLTTAFTRVDDILNTCKYAFGMSSSNLLRGDDESGEKALEGKIPEEGGMHEGIDIDEGSDTSSSSGSDSEDEGGMGGLKRKERFGWPK